MLNNFFGIVGKNNLRRTHSITSRYKQYATEIESFVDFCRLISRKRFYPSLKGNKSIQQWVRSIAAAGYSEAPVVWQQRVMSTIRKNRL
jgi:flagellum-specific peptidoglycan hydrolase FlgJ